MPKGSKKTDKIMEYLTTQAVGKENARETKRVAHAIGSSVVSTYTLLNKAQRKYPCIKSQVQGRPKPTLWWTEGAPTMTQEKHAEDFNAPTSIPQGPMDTSASMPG